MVGVKLAGGAEREGAALIATRKYFVAAGRSVGRVVGAADAPATGTEGRVEGIADCERKGAIEGVGGGRRLGGA